MVELVRVGELRQRQLLLDGREDARSVASESASVTPSKQKEATRVQSARGAAFCASRSYLMGVLTPAVSSAGTPLWKEDAVERVRRCVGLPHTYISIHLSICPSTYLSICMYVCIYIYIYVCTCVFIYIYSCKYIHVYIYIYIYYVYVYIY